MLYFQFENLMTILDRAILKLDFKGTGILLWVYEYNLEFYKDNFCEILQLFL